MRFLFVISIGIFLIITMLGGWAYATVSLVVMIPLAVIFSSSQVEYRVIQTIGNDPARVMYTGPLDECRGLVQAALDCHRAKDCEIGIYGYGVSLSDGFTSQSHGRTHSWYIVRVP